MSDPAAEKNFQDEIIAHLTARGFMEPAALYDAPFSSIHADGPEGLFAGKPNIIDGLFHTLEETLLRVMVFSRSATFPPRIADCWRGW
jgi:type I restriction enzyme R subunit